MASANAMKQRQIHNSGHNHGFNLAMIVMVVALVAIGFAYLIDARLRQNTNSATLADAGPTIEKIVGGQRLAIPAAWFRYADGQTEGFSDNVELQFTLPLGINGADIDIEVSLTPITRVRTSARLLDAVYLHQFLPKQQDGIVGLIGKPLKGANGFQNETVWYDPISSTPFVAKCMAPVAPGDPTSCMRSVEVNRYITATYVFDASALGLWKRFDAEAAPWLVRIGGF